MHAQTGDGDLAAYREIAVVLGGGLEADGSANALAIARADAAAELARRRPVALILSGSHGEGPRPMRTEAAVMADRLIASGIAPSRIFLEERSRDTVTNAAYVAKRYLTALTPRRLVIVTSPFHMARALVTFALVLGEAWPLEAYAASAVPDEDERIASERIYEERTRALLAGYAPGDVAGIAEHVRTTLRERVSDG